VCERKARTPRRIPAVARLSEVFRRVDLISCNSTTLPLQIADPVASLRAAAPARLLEEGQRPFFVQADATSDGVRDAEGRAGFCVSTLAASAVCSYLGRLPAARRWRGRSGASVHYGRDGRLDEFAPLRAPEAGNEEPIPRVQGRPSSNIENMPPRRPRERPAYLGDGPGRMCHPNL